MEIPNYQQANENTRSPNFKESLGLI